MNGWLNPRYAFAALKADGSVVTWGAQSRGGNSLAVQASLVNVQEIQATDYAFAAILADRTVVVWGDPQHGGSFTSGILDPNSISEIRNVAAIQSTKSAFAAILADGSVVSWGWPDHGGDSWEVQDRLKDVKQIQSNNFAFAALLGDGSVVAGSNSARLFCLGRCFPFFCRAFLKVLGYINIAVNVSPLYIPRTGH